MWFKVVYSDGLYLVHGGAQTVSHVYRLAAHDLRNCEISRLEPVPAWRRIQTRQHVYQVGRPVHAGVTTDVTPAGAIERKLKPSVISKLAADCDWQYTGPCVVRAAPDDNTLLLSGQYRLGVRDGVWDYRALGFAVEYNWSSEIALRDAARAGDVISMLERIACDWGACYSRIPGFEDRLRAFLMASEDAGARSTFLAAK